MAGEQGNARLVARNSVVSCVITVQAQMRNQGSTAGTPKCTVPIYIILICKATDCWLEA